MVHLIGVLVPLLAAGAPAVSGRCAVPPRATIVERLRSGDCYAAGQQWKQAEEQYRICRRADPRAEAPTVRHADALIHLNRPFDAAVELSELLESSPDSVPGLKLYAGLLASALENEARAESVLERCLKLAPSDPEGWQAMGDLLLGQRRMEEAARHLETAVRLSPGNPLLVADLARCRAQAGESAKAEELFRQAAELNKSAASPDARVSLLYGQYLLEQGRAPESVELLTKSLLLRARSAEARFARASAYEQMKDWGHAEADALAAIRLSPRRMDAHLLLLRAYRAQRNTKKIDEYSARIKELDEAGRAVQSEKRRSREALRLYFEEVQPRLRDRDYAGAIKPSLESVDLWPSFTSPLFILGVCYSQTGQTDQALVSFRKFIALEPASAEGHAALGVLLLQLDRKQEALVPLERAIALDPGMLEARKAAASIHLSMGNASAAVAVLKGADSLDVEARSMLARALVEPSQNQCNAIERRIAARSRCDPALHLALARCRAQSGDTARAIAACEHAIETCAPAPDLDRLYVSLLRNTWTKAERRAKLTQALRHRPESPALMMALAEVLLSEDPVALQAEIEPLVRKAALALPLDPEAHYLYGQWACLNDRQDLSVRELNRALELMRGNPRARMQTHAYLGIAYDRMHQRDNAERSFREAVALNRTLPAPDPGTFMQYARFLIDEQREEQAQQLIAELLRAAPAFALAHLERGKFLADHEQPGQALAEGELALRYAGNDLAQQRAAHAFLARVFHALGRAGEAKLHQQWIESHSRP